METAPVPPRAVMSFFSALLGSGIHVHSIFSERPSSNPMDLLNMPNQSIAVISCPPRSAT